MSVAESSRPASSMLLSANPRLRRLSLMAMDAVLLAFALAAIFALWLPLREGRIPARYVSLYLHVLLPMVGLKILFFAWLGLYRAMARRTGTYELLLIAAGDTMALAAIAVLNYSTRFVPSLGSWPMDLSGEHLLRVPWGVVLTDWMAAMIVAGGVRVLRREIEFGVLSVRPEGSRRVLIVGAGDAGEQVARDLSHSTQGRYQPVAYVDPDRKLAGIRLHGVPVVGTIDDLPRAIAEHCPDEIVIALENPSPRLVSEIVAHCRSARLAFKIVPALGSLMSGRIGVSTLRPVGIEDLLGRPAVTLGQGARAELAGKRVLVTGAGGSIGQELCRQAIAQRPAALVMLGRGENSLFEAAAELGSAARDAGVALETVVGDVRDEPAMRRLFARARPQVVFHAAAHKHVHLMEAQPSEAVLNNVRGTLAAARAAMDCGAEKFVLISTDKAVRPTGIMGASKRVAEMIVSAMNEERRGTFLSVRFGNVLGSRGSVIPTFRRQIERGGPVTVTDPEVTRYFMTTAEAVSLTLEAAAQGRGGEVFILDMGQPVRIADLARNLISLSGLEPEIDIPVVFTGLRPGEKLKEELLTEDEGVSATEHGKIFIARNERRPWSELGPKLEALFAAAEVQDEERVRALLRELVPDFKPLAERAGA